MYSVIANESIYRFRLLMLIPTKLFRPGSIARFFNQNYRLKFLLGYFSTRYLFIFFTRQSFKRDHYYGRRR